MFKCKEAGNIYYKRDMYSLLYLSDWMIMNINSIIRGGKRNGKISREKSS